MFSVYSRMCAYAFPPWLEERKREMEIRFTVQTRAALASHGLPRPLDVPLLRPRSARKNLSANVGRGYVGEPFPLVPFGISPYVPRFLSSSVSLSQFNSALFHRLRISPFLHRSFSLRLFPVTSVTISRLFAMMKWFHFFRCLSISRLFLPVYMLIRFALYLCSFYLLSFLQYSKNTS